MLEEDTIQEVRQTHNREEHLLSTCYPVHILHINEVFSTV